MNEEERRRVLPANIADLDVPDDGSVFEAHDGGRSVDCIAYDTRTGRVLIGRAMVHQALLDRYAPETRFDDCVRGDLFARVRRLELDSSRAASSVDRYGIPCDGAEAWENIWEAIYDFRQIGFPKTWKIVVDGEELEQ